MLILCGFLFLISTLFSITEACFERDWPRDTWKFPALFAILWLLVAFSN